MALSNRARAALLNAFIGKTGDFGTLSSLPSFFLAASTADPLADGSGLTEPSTSGTAYARFAVAETDFSAATEANPALLISDEDLAFARATLTWGTITHLALMDSITAGAGNLLDRGALTTPRLINAGGILRVSATGFTLGMG
jgi:hypothetical protein